MSSAVRFAQCFWSRAGSLASLGRQTGRELRMGLTPQSNFETSIRSYVKGCCEIKVLLYKRINEFLWNYISRMIDAYCSGHYKIPTLQRTCATVLAICELVE